MTLGPIKLNDGYISDVYFKDCVLGLVDEQSTSWEGDHFIS